jgi:hypothetical protein
VSALGVREGDVLRAINDHPVLTEGDVPKTLNNLGPYPTVKYSLERNGVVFPSTPVFIGPPEQRLVRQRLYLEIIGLYYFLAGAFVLIKSFRSTHAFHFYFVCLFSFVLFSYSYTGKLDAFDWTVFWLDTAASVFLPPAFPAFLPGISISQELVSESCVLALAALHSRHDPDGNLGGLRLRRLRSGSFAVALSRDS